MLFDWWTLALQAVNVLILAWLLGRFFFRPVAAIIEKRQVEARKLLTDADRARADVQKSQAEIAATREGFAAERHKMLESAKAEAEAARSALLETAREDADKFRARSEAEWRQERQAMQEVLLHRAGTLATDIARRLLERLSGDGVTALFVESLRKRLSGLPETERALIATAARRGDTLDLVAAAPLTSAQKTLCEDALKQASGSQPHVTFRTDPALIAGIEIHGPDIMICDSWRNDLDGILKELSEDARASQGI